MAVIPDAVPQGALFYEQIYKRGGAQGRYKDFALCKCPHCEHIILIAYEHDTLYLDPIELERRPEAAELETLYLDADDLGRREGIRLGVGTHRCEDCGESFPPGRWIGPEAPEDMQVSWSDLADSPWCWLTTPTLTEVPAEEPFEPPAGLAVEPELRGEPPRPLPEEFRHSWFARERRTAVRLMLVFGLCFLGLALLPVMELWTQILPPLNLLLWGGAALVVGAALLNVSALNGTARRYNYVRHGVTTVARIRSRSFGPQFGHSHDAPHRYTVRFDYIDPELAEHQKAELLEGAAPVNLGRVAAEGLSDAIPVGLKDNVSLTYRKGDYVTAVYFPGKLQRTIRLYGLLALRDDLGVVIHVPVKPIGWWPIALGISILFGFLLLGAWTYYVWWRYWPLEHPPGAFIWPLTLGALVFGALAALRWIYVKVRARSRPSADEVFDETAIPAFGVPALIFAVLTAAALGSVTMLCFFVAANACFDQAPPTRHEVTLNNNPKRDVTVLWVPIYRPCTMSGKFDADQKKFVHVCPPAERAALQQPGGRMITRGVAEVRPGWLGWTWLERVQTKP